MTAKNGLIASTVAGLVLISAYLYVQREDARDRALEAHLRADSIEAASDTTRLVYTGAILRLRDSVIVWARRSSQEKQATDELNKKLDNETRAHIEAQLKIKSLRSQLEGEVLSDKNDVRYATFTEDTERFNLLSEVSLPAPPAKASGTFVLDIKPVPVQVRLTCSDGENGIASAETLFITPSDIELTIDKTTQDPGVCNPQLYDSPSFLGISLPAGPVLGGLAGATVGYVSDGKTESVIGGALLGAVTGFVFDELLGKVLN